MNPLPMANLQKRPLALIILDGWGHREETEANAIAAARKPHWDHLLQTFAHTLISGSGRCVGLPDGQMGNSEVGHLNMGAGRIVHQDLTKIDEAIENESFFQNPLLIKAFTTAKATGHTVHLMGLFSPGGVHSHERHLLALLKLAKQLDVRQVAIHAFLDGRDTPPKSAASSIALIEGAKWGRIVSMIGRYYAMDRDKRWERVEEAYHLLVLGQAKHQASSAEAALADAYARGETDEFVQSTAIHAANEAPTTIKAGDSVIFFNYRADRAREITEALVSPTFQGFPIPHRPAIGMFVCLAEYDEKLNLPVAYPPEPLTNILAACLSEHQLSQLRIAETEKYAHVTFFFNGGVETPYPLEDRLLVPSPKVATYDLKPEMSADEITAKLVNVIENKQYDVIICNFANPDMVGHTGNFAATVQAIEKIDECLGKIAASLQKVGGEMLITADHGNAELMFDKRTNQPHTAHTSDPVPFIYVGRPANIVNKEGKLSDIAPTMLYLLGLPQPKEMSGTPLVKLV